MECMDTSQQMEVGQNAQGYEQQQQQNFGPMDGGAAANNTSGNTGDGGGRAQEDRQGHAVST